MIMRQPPAEVQRSRWVCPRGNCELEPTCSMTGLFPFICASGHPAALQILARVGHWVVWRYPHH